MFDIGISEIGVIAVVALVVLGPERLPRVARTVGTLLGRAQRYVNDVKAEVNREIELEELRKLQTEMKQAAESVQQQMSSVGTEVQAAVDDVGKNLQSGLDSVGQEVQSVADAFEGAASTAANTGAAADTLPAIPSPPPPPPPPADTVAHLYAPLEEPPAESEPGSPHVLPGVGPLRDPRAAASVQWPKRVLPPPPPPRPRAPLADPRAAANIVVAPSVAPVVAEDPIDAVHADATGPQDMPPPEPPAQPSLFQ